MVRRLARIVMMFRDITIALLSVVLISTDIGPGKEMSNLLLAAIAGVVLALTAVNVAFNILRAKGKGFYYVCSYAELAVGVFMLGLFPPYGVLLVAFSLAVLVTLFEKKQQLLGEAPPKPLTNTYRILVAVAAVAILAGLLLPLISSLSFSLIGVYSSILGKGSSAALPSVTLSPAAVFFALLILILTPVSLLTSVLGYFRRRFMLLTSVFAIVSSAGWILALDILNGEAGISAGPGAFSIILGGGVALAAYLMVRGRVQHAG